MRLLFTKSSTSFGRRTNTFNANFNSSVIPFGPDVSNKPTSPRQKSSSSVWQQDVVWHVHRIRPPYRKTTVRRLAHCVLGRHRKEHRLRCPKQKIQVPRNTTLHSTDTICVLMWRMEREATPMRKSNNILPTKRDATATQTTPAKHTSKCRARSGRFLQHLKLSRLPAPCLPRSTRIIVLDPSEVHQRESAVKKKKRSLGRKIMYKESPHSMWTKHRTRKPLTSLRKFRHGVTI